MATTDSSASALTVPGEVRLRVLRGVKLFRDRAGEIQQRHGVYSVPSSTEGGFYEVCLDVWGEGESCSCPDHTYRGVSCAHLIAATIARSKHMAESRRRRGPRRSAADVQASLDKMGA